MSCIIYSKEDQGSGSFDNGRIQEYKPIGFPGEGGKLKPYSNIFYWAYAWSNEGGLISEHPHKGFEIMSFILRGEVLHYDSQIQDWLHLEEGDVQIIRSGNGITHAEKLLPGSAIFQIWVDPNLHLSLGKKASYTDYRLTEFPIRQEANFAVKILKDDNGPIAFDAEGIHILEYEMQDNVAFKIQLNEQMIYSCYLLEGSISINEMAIRKHDFIVIASETFVDISVEEKAKLFVFQSPKKLSYPTYAETYL